MPRIGFIGVLILSPWFLTLGCAKTPPASPETPTPVLENGTAEAALSPPGQAAGIFVPRDDDRAANSVTEMVKTPAAPAPELNQREKYDAALMDALNLMADRKYAEALVSLGTARGIQDTDQIGQIIDRVKAQLEQRALAEQTGQTIQAVLKDGKPEDAGRLAAEGLQQFGTADAGVDLAKLQREAEALTAAQTTDQAKERSRLRLEGDSAVRDNNLRGAAVAYEQILRYGDDKDVQRQLDDIRGTLARYDDNRQRAAALRRDPANLEEALVSLGEAAKAWDTPQVRQEIDDYNLALQKRRERIAVADFEVRGETGIPMAGRTLAEELLPAFKPRFDLVEREQLGKVIDELRLEDSALGDNESGRREVGRLAKVRYLVLGSVSAWSGITVNARLVDTRTGLVVQTARIVARSPEELIPTLPQLANRLMLDDNQKMAYEQQLANLQPPPAPAIIVASLPPAPPIPLVGQPVPPPLIVYSPLLPALGGVRLEDFSLLAPPPPIGFAEPPVVVERDEPIRQRLLQISLQLGDNLFLRGRFREAHTQFELAFNLCPQREEVRLRVDRCRPLLPPPPPVVVAPPAGVIEVAASTPPVIVVTPSPRPRIAVLNFVVNADPGLVPPGLGDWAAEQCASYFTPAYEVVDRGEVCWYMGRLGLTYRDVLADASARRWLGRAMNIRFFVFGAIQQTASFEVTTHLVDAETGYRQGGGRIHVQDHQELKLRMGELAGQTKSGPADQPLLQQKAKDTEKALLAARQLAQTGQPAQAAAICRAGLVTNPGHAGLETVLQQAETQLRDDAMAQRRQQEYKARLQQLPLMQQKQTELVRQSVAVKNRLVQNLNTPSEAERQAREAKRQKAHDQLVAQGLQAIQQGQNREAVQLLESAVALKPSNVAAQNLALARAKVSQIAQATVTQEAARRQRDLAAKQVLLEKENQQRALDDQVRRKDQETRDQAAYARFMDLARLRAQEKKYDLALEALQSAGHLRKTEEVDRLVKQVQNEKVMAQAKTTGIQAVATLQQRLAEEKKAKDQADTEARKRQESYNLALQMGRQAAANQHYDVAVTQYQEAARYFKTDVALSGIKQAQNALVQERLQAETRQRQQADEARRAADLGQFIAKGQKALAANQLDAASVALAQAGKLAPNHPDVIKGLALVEQARITALAQARQKVKPPAMTEVQLKKRLEEYQNKMKAGRQALSGKRVDEAAKAFTEAAGIMPGDKDAAAMLKEVDKARAGGRR